MTCSFIHAESVPDSSNHLQLFTLTWISAKTNTGISSEHETNESSNDLNGNGLKELFFASIKCVLVNVHNYIGGAIPSSPTPRAKYLGLFLTPDKCDVMTEESRDFFSFILFNIGGVSFCYSNCFICSKLNIAEIHRTGGLKCARTFSHIVYVLLYHYNHL